MQIYEIELFSSDGGCSYLNGEKHEIKRGNLLFTKPGDRRHSEFHFSTRYVHFETDNASLKHLLDSFSGFYAGDYTESLETLFDEIADLVFSAIPCAEIFAAAKLMDLLLTVSQFSQIPQLHGENLPEHNSAIAKAIDFMEGNYTSRLHTEEIARHCGMSVSYFYKKFLEQTGLSPNAYLKQIRISAAKKLLATSQIPISLVSERCGFTSQAYFTYCFRQTVGKSPLEFRRGASFEV